jgi:hypothetical protein
MSLFEQAARRGRRVKRRAAVILRTRDGFDLA